MCSLFPGVVRIGMRDGGRVKASGLWLRHLVGAKDPGRRLQLPPSACRSSCAAPVGIKETETRVENPCHVKDSARLFFWGERVYVRGMAEGERSRLGEVAR